MSEEKRSEILHGVLAVIATQGLAAVSFRSVAQEAGVSPGRVQHYFSSKTDLVRGGLDYMLRVAELANPGTADEASEPGTLWALLTHALAPAVESRVGTSIYYSYLAASVSDPWIHDALAEARTGLLGRVADCLRAQYPAVSDPATRALRLVMLADGATEGVFLGWLTPEDARATIRTALEDLATA